MATLIAIPILSGLLILQTSILSRLPLLQGTTDLTMLAIIAWALQKRVQTAWQWCIMGGLFYNLVSALPLGVPVIGYCLTTGITLILRRRVWQVPILSMFVATLLGTLITQGLAIFTLRFAGSPIPIIEAINLVILPSAILNLVLAIPIFALIGDLANWLYPEELEV